MLDVTVVQIFLATVASGATEARYFILLEMKKKKKAVEYILKRPPPNHHPFMAKDILPEQNLVITNILPLLPKDQIFYWWYRIYYNYIEEYLKGEVIHGEGEEIVKTTSSII